MLESTVNIQGGFLDRGDGLIASAELGDAVLPNGQVIFSAGVGDYQVTDAYHATFTILPDHMLMIDVVEGGLLNHKNLVLALKSIKSIMVRLDKGFPQGVRFGPMGQAGAAQLWEDNDLGTEVGTGMTPTGCERIDSWGVLYRTNPEKGWLVDAGNKYINIFNPSATLAATGKIWLLGVTNGSG